MWLYSIEPSLYTDINKAVTENAMSNLDSLGPIAYAMDLIVKYAEINKTERLPVGN